MIPHVLSKELLIEDADAVFCVLGRDVERDFCQEEICPDSSRCKYAKAFLHSAHQL